MLGILANRIRLSTEEVVTVTMRRHMSMVSIPNMFSTYRWVTAYGTPSHRDNSYPIVCID